jgi:hypothetical protein
MLERCMHGLFVSEINLNSGAETKNCSLYSGMLQITIEGLNKWSIPEKKEPKSKESV